ncbi:hypothetical protein [Schinkia azotoformans]|uniref:hypothetical protein n=1 Tax=Schinkia azotoformans TaxID=1454 RepID=UPI002DB60C66|nr:hypothetical protein [Schinkia azotoformans]MEC1780061.1 hypothetical protein [Schinkia azotoformans]MED4330860.1 hypothetical protein [Schinkia azotoformans]
MIKDLILAAISGGVISVGLTKWIGKIINDRLKINWQSKAQKELENVKADLNITNELLKSSISAYALGHSYAQERRMQAVERIWESMMLYREYSVPVITFHSVLLPNEFNTVIRESKDIFNVSEITGETLYNVQIKNKDIDKIRPFVGEYIWSLFVSYRSFLLRLCYLFISGREKNNISSWNSDRHLVEILSYTLRENYEKINFSSINSLQIVLNTFEQVILIELEKLISGEKISENSYKEARKLLELSTELEEIKRK